MVIDEVSNERFPRYLIYDIITFKGIEVGKTEFSRRLLCIQKEIVGARRTYINEVLIYKLIYGALKESNRHTRRDHTSGIFPSFVFNVISFVG